MLAVSALHGQWTGRKKQARLLIDHEDSESLGRFLTSVRPGEMRLRATNKSPHLPTFWLYHSSFDVFYSKKVSFKGTPFDLAISRPK